MGGPRAGPEGAPSPRDPALTQLRAPAVLERLPLFPRGPQSWPSAACDGSAWPPLTEAVPHQSLGRGSRDRRSRGASGD